MCAYLIPREVRGDHQIFRNRTYYHMGPLQATCAEPPFLSRNIFILFYFCLVIFLKQLSLECLHLLGNRK